MSVLDQLTTHNPTQYVVKRMDQEPDHSFSFNGEIKKVVSLCNAVLH
jgi:hypothetical protein